MTNWLRNIKIRTAIILVAAIPVFIAFIYSVQLVTNDLRLVRELNALEKLTALSIKMSDLVHEQQIERGISALYVGSQGQQFQGELIVQRKQTDKKRQEFLNFLHGLDISFYGQEFTDSLDRLAEELARLNALRAQIDALTIPVSEVIQYFKNLNAQNLHIVSMLALLSSNAEIANHIHAYVNFMLAKENVGIERAVSSGALGQGDFSEQTLSKLKKLITIQDTYIQVFLSVATEAQQDFYADLMQNNAVLMVQRMRRKMFSNGVANGNSVQQVHDFAIDWFNNITAKINLFKQMQNRLAGDLESRMSQLKQDTQRSKDNNFIIALSSTVLALLVCFIIIRVITQSFREVVVAMSELAKGNVNGAIPAETDNEMGAMVKALKVFKENKIKADRLTSEIEKQHRIESALNELSEKLHGQQNMAVLAQLIVHQLARHLDIQFVALFVLRKKKCYNREATYGYPKQGGVTTFECGDGLLGQAVNDAQPIMVTDIPEHARLSLGLGSAAADCLLIHPLIHSGRVVAVLELAGFNLQHTDDKREWLDKASEGLAVTIRLVLDLEQRNLVAKELAKAKEAAEAANKAKSGFLANMSHELRTPMNAILGYSEMLMEEAEEAGQDDFIPDLKKIHQSGSHLLALINEVLDLSKIESGKMEVFAETFDADSLIDQIVGTTQPLMAKNNNQFTVVRGTGNNEPLSEAYLDITKLRQSLLNLLSNAAKFTKDGDVKLTIQRIAETDGDWLVFAVSDTGIGIAEEKLEYVFEEFSQADNSTTRNYGGTGLGLAISRRFCRMMGGDLWVTSRLGEGSTFTIKIPARYTNVDGKTHASGDGQTTAASTASQPTQETFTLPEIPSKPGSTVLVIDDDPVAREIIQRLLEKEGFNVVTAPNGEQGLRLAHRVRPTVITLDVMMPDMDGWSVLRALKANPELESIPVVMLTMVEDKSTGFSLGATDYLTKPINREQLHKVLSKYYVPDKACAVLLVEDDVSIREMMVHALEKTDWRVMEASDGRAALAQLEHNKPQLIILDLMMPIMDGFEFLIELRAHAQWQDIPVIVLTAKDLTEEDRRILSGRVEQIFEKNAASHEQLMQVIHQVMVRTTSS